MTATEYVATLPASPAVEASDGNAAPGAHEYLFDVKLFTSFRFTAANEAEARRLLAEALDCASINAGQVNGQTLLGEASMDGDADLVEVDGEAV